MGCRTTSINDTDNAGQVISRYDYGYDAADHISTEQAAVPRQFLKDITLLLLMS